MSVGGGGGGGVGVFPCCVFLDRLISETKKPSPFLAIGSLSKYLTPAPIPTISTPLQRHAEDRRGSAGQGTYLHPVVKHLGLCLHHRLRQRLEASTRRCCLRSALFRRGCHTLQGNNSACGVV